MTAKAKTPKKSRDTKPAKISVNKAFGGWWWKCDAANYEELARSTQLYSRKIDCLAAIKLVQGAEVVHPKGTRK